MGAGGLGGVEEEVRHGVLVEVAGRERYEDEGVLVDSGELGNGDPVGDGDGLFEVLVVAGVGDFLDVGLRGYFEQFDFQIAVPLGGAAVEHRAYGAVALAFGSDGEGGGEGAELVEEAFGVDADVVVFGSGEGSVLEVGTIGQANEVALLLFGAGPEFAHVGHPSGVEHFERAVAVLHSADAVVE